MGACSCHDMMERVSGSFFEAEQLLACLTGQSCNRSRFVHLSSDLCARRAFVVVARGTYWSAAAGLRVAQQMEVPAIAGAMESVSQKEHCG